MILTGLYQMELKEYLYGIIGAELIIMAQSDINLGSYKIRNGK